jgi:hypothetical protein
LVNLPEFVSGNFVLIISRVMSSSKSSANAELKEKILVSLSNGRLHHTLVLPATAVHGELLVTYSVVGAGADELPLRPIPDGKMDGKIPTIIWVGPMMGGRWQGANTHHLASQEGIRIVYVDRYASSLFCLMQHNLCLGLF